MCKEVTAAYISQAWEYFAQREQRQNATLQLCLQKMLLLLQLMQVDIKLNT